MQSEFTNLNSHTIFSPEHELYRETCRKFYQKEIEPNYKIWEKNAGTPPDLWLKAGQAGILGPAIPEQYGGAGGDFLYDLIQAEELGKIVGGASVGAGITTDVLTHILIGSGSEEQKQKWFPKILSGEAIQAMALTEPDVGSDATAIKARAYKDGDDYILNGTKCYCTNGGKGNLLYIVAKTEEDIETSKSNMTMFIVEPDMPGVVQRRMDTIGMKAGDIGEIFLSEVRVPSENIVGELGQGLRKNLINVFITERATIPARAYATAELAFELTLDYVKNRKVFGQTVFDFQNTKMKLAEMKANLIAAKAFQQKLMLDAHNNTLDIPAASAAKFWFTEMSYQLIDACLQLHGGYGYMSESAISRLYTFSRVERIYGGTTEMQKLNVAKWL